MVHGHIISDVNDLGLSDLHSPRCAFHGLLPESPSSLIALATPFAWSIAPVPLSGPSLCAVRL